MRLARTSAILALSLVVGLVGPVAITAAALSGALSEGSAPLGALLGAAVPLEWLDAEDSSACPQVPISILGALGFVASGSGRWITQPPPWGSRAEGPLGLGAATGPLSHQIRQGALGLCWLAAQSSLAAALALATGSDHEAIVIGVLASALSEAPLLSASRAQALTFAASAMGLPYRWGGNGPDAYDCSGLMVAAWRSAGVALPRTAQAQYEALTVSGGVPGDLVFYGARTREVTHVGMWVRNGVLLDAPFTGAVVRLDPMDLRTAISVGAVGGADG